MLSGAYVERGSPIRIFSEVKTNDESEESNLKTSSIKGRESVEYESLWSKCKGSSRRGIEPISTAKTG